MFSQSSAITSGTSEGKGFYDLTEYYGDGSDAGAADEGLLSRPKRCNWKKSRTYGSTYGYGYGYITGQGNYPSKADPMQGQGPMVMVMAMVYM